MNPIRRWWLTLTNLRRPATLYLVGEDEFRVIFDPFPHQERLRPLLAELNAHRTRIPWPGHRVLQFGFAGEEGLPGVDGSDGEEYQQCQG
jgi:hypothetical protein